MSLIVQKFGGTSVGSPEKIKAVAERVIDYNRQGHEMIVVLSAMSGETDRLVSLANAMQDQPDTREMDVLLSTGEQVTISLFAMAIKTAGADAISFLGDQVQILTDSMHTKARIKSIDQKKIRTQLDQGKIVVVAGFQGVDENGNITTLGRGGSDTTAVALAASLYD
jgi:aspartate kinase